MKPSGAATADLIDTLSVEGKAGGDPAGLSVCYLASTTGSSMKLASAPLWNTLCVAFT